jgi:glycosyltransferase involved in cell wall biosynthesis
MTQPRVSLLMPNRNNEAMLELVLDRLAAHTTYPDFELIVVDDGSTDGSLEILRRWRDSGRFSGFLLLEREHGGVVDALNAGLEAATGELVVQLDADASIETPGWLERMVDFFVSDERIGVVTAKIVYDRGTINACGINVVGPAGLHDGGTEISEPLGRRTYHFRVFRPREADCEKCKRIAEVDGGIGCCMMYRRSLALEAGGYDPGYAPVWFDDLDLTISIRRLGYKVFFFPDVRVLHQPGMRAKERLTPRQTTVAVLKRVRFLLPARGRMRVVQGLNLDRPRPDIRERFAHHYAYWREKWGFDMLNPDMGAIRDRWGDTEICWRSNPEMLEAGKRIVAAYEKQRTVD